MESLGRRRLLQSGAAWSAASYARILGANQRIRIGGIGTGGRGQHLLSVFHQQPDTGIEAVCDVYEPRRLQAQTSFASGGRAYLDYRELLEQKDIDAVVIGSPDHWHARMIQDSVAAGKDVYVEKPVTHSLGEGDALVDAVSKSDRVVQAGYQQRSWPHFLEARQAVQEGVLGQVTMVLTYWYQNHLDEPRRADVSRAMPDKLDWKRWLGAAPEQPFRPLLYLSWRWFWDFGGGALTDLFSHWVDVAHWFMQADTPRRVQAMGSGYAMPEFECPDTTSAFLDYGKFGISYVGTLNGYREGGGLIFRGTKAMMRLHRAGYGIYPEVNSYTEKPSSGKPEEAPGNRDGTIDHIQNFLSCVRSRKEPNAPIRSSVNSARAAHLANLAMRSQKVLQVPDDVRCGAEPCRG